MLTKTQPPTELQIPATITTLVSGMENSEFNYVHTEENSIYMHINFAGSAIIALFEIS